MREVVFCSRCRGMEAGWNRSYVRHRLTCVPGFSRTLRVSGLFVSALLAIVLLPNGAMAPASSAGAESEMSVWAQPELPLLAPTEVRVSDPEVADPTVSAVEDLLGRHTRVTSVERARIAKAVVASSRAHDVDPFLVTGILIAESSGDPFAISHRQAVGIMQIHVPTWGTTAEAEGINLFLLEDNIDLGTRILRDYTRRHGLWQGVMRYLGAAEPTDEANAYVQRVQGVYADRQAD